VIVDAATVGGTSAIGGAAAQMIAATQAFDEALTKAEVITIIQGFVKNDPARGLP